jgi:hypothetical protein
MDKVIPAIRHALSVVFLCYSRKIVSLELKTCRASRLHYTGAYEPTFIGLVDLCGYATLFVYLFFCYNTYIHTIIHS